MCTSCTSIDLILELTMHGKFLSVVMAFVIGFSCLSAEASKRLGSGKSVGQQSNNVSQSQGASKPTQNATPAAPAAPPPAPVTSATAVFAAKFVTAPKYTLFSEPPL